jgi:hypothetical protein
MDAQKYESNKMWMPAPVMQKVDKMRQSSGMAGGICRMAVGSNVNR